MSQPRRRHNDQVDHPAHYTAHPSGVECITVAEHFNFNVGNAIKYLWRAGKKESLLLDLEKARFYVEREIARLTVEQAQAFAEQQATPAKRAKR